VVTMKLAKAKRGTKAVGTGFLPLDLVYRDDNPSKLKAYAGGTCGNVLVILAFLGWDVYPVARHNDSPLGRMIRDDLKLWGAHLDFMSVEPTALPPAVVQRVFAKPRSGKTHSFAWVCPGCGAPLPSFKPVLSKSVLEISDSLPKMQVFFFDRVSRAALDLAKKCAETGGIVVFEPSMIGEPRLFSEAINMSHVFKYSQDRISDVHEVRGSAEPLIEIETLGSAGLRYRRRGRVWKEVDAFSIRRTVDTSGAGDWCTAGILHVLCQDGVHGLQRATDQDALSAVRLGQAMAAWTCQFEGARGGMYGVSWANWKKEVTEIAQNGSTLDQMTPQSARVCPEVLLDVCRPTSADSLNHAGHVPYLAEKVCATLWPGGGGGKTLPQRT
jgi:sugar/nucleoside kinase (ribokinase family)